MKKHKKRKIILPILTSVLLIILLNWRVIVKFTGDAIKNLNKNYREINRIINDEKFRYLTVNNVTENDGVFQICLELTGSTDDYDKILEESVKAFDDITNKVNRSSDMYNKKLQLTIRESDSLPELVIICNYEYDFKAVKSKVENEFSFSDIVSINIDCPVTNLDCLKKRKILILETGSNCDLVEANIVKEDSTASKKANRK